MFHVYKRIVVVVVMLALVVPVFFSFALTPQEERTALEKELAELEGQIADIEGDITKTQQEKETLQNRIYILKQEIRKLDLQIAQSNRLIEDLRSQITDTTGSIDNTITEIDSTRGQLGNILQSMYQEDQKSVVEIVLEGNTLSDFFNNVAALESLRGRNRELLENMKELTVYLQSQKEALEGEKVDEENFVKIQILQKQQSQSLTNQNESLLSQTKGKESEYQKLLANKQAQASEIRSRIFELIGVPDAPTFGEAVTIASAVSQQTGVRTAFLLAVLTQESNLGKNVGQCYIKDTQTGDGIYVKTGEYVRRVMKPMGLPGRGGDITDFLRITQALGRDPFNTPVSCPIPSVGGYGGAMGPAQFIPTTWALYEAEMKSLLGRSADPWNIKDAFLASAVYLGDVGATKQTYEYEWCAAVSYFSGNCSLRNQINYEFYGDNVMAIAKRYESDIAALQN